MSFSGKVKDAFIYSGCFYNTFVNCNVPFEYSKTSVFYVCVFKIPNASVDAVIV